MHASDMQVKVTEN